MIGPSVAEAAALRERPEDRPLPDELSRSLHDRYNKSGAYPPGGYTVRQAEVLIAGQNAQARMAGAGGGSGNRAFTPAPRELAERIAAVTKFPVEGLRTYADIDRALKARNPNIRIGLADPFGAALYSYYTTGVLKAEGSSITEGIGQGRITANLEGAPIDVAYQIPDNEALDIVFALVVGAADLGVAGEGLRDPLRRAPARRPRRSTWSASRCRSSTSRSGAGTSAAG